MSAPNQHSELREWASRYIEEDRGQGRIERRLAERLLELEEQLEAAQQEVAEREQAIPPVYTQHIGAQLLAHIGAEVAV